jgi:hypothetical protein
MRTRQARLEQLEAAAHCSRLIRCLRTVRKTLQGPTTWSTCDQRHLLIDDEDAARGAEVLDQVRAQIVPHRVGIPCSAVEQALHALRTCLAELLGQLPAILALDPLQQPGQIPFRPLPLFRTPKATAHPRVEVSEHGSPTGQILLRHHHPASVPTLRHGSLGDNCRCSTKVKRPLPAIRRRVGRHRWLPAQVTGRSGRCLAWQVPAPSRQSERVIIRPIFFHFTRLVEGLLL